MEMKIEKLECVNDNIKDYHSKDCISASGLKLIYKRSIFHYLNKEFKKTSAMDLGNAAHILLYEGLEKFGEEYFVFSSIKLFERRFIFCFRIYLHFIVPPPYFWHNFAQIYFQRT